MTARPSRLFISLAFAALLAGCGQQGADDLLASAKDYLAKHDEKAAVIQLKNALQKSPESAETRFLLGRTLLDLGDPASAEVELRKSLSLKHPPSQVVPPLARALVATQGYKKLLDEHGATSLPEAPAMADLQTSLAVAYAALGNSAKATAALQSALELQPAYARALVFKARREAGEGKLAQATVSIDRALAAAAADKEALQFKGDLLQAQGDLPGAIAAYRKAVAVDPAYLPAQASLIEAYFTQRDTPAVTAQIAELRKSQPNHPQTLYLEAKLAYADNDNKKARELMQKVLRMAPGNPKALLLAGAVEARDQSLVQAEEYVNKALQAAPNLPGARQLLAQTQIRAGQADKALATLEPLLAAPAKPDAETLSLAAQAEMQTGELKQAEAHLVQAAEVDPTQTRSRVALALNKAKGHSVDAALSEIESIAAADEGSFADVVLINAYLRKQEFDKALAVVGRLEKKEAGKQPYGANLRGRVQLLRKDTADARRSFERALSIDPAFVPAAANLALLDLADNRPEQARKRFEGVLAADPRNLQAQLAIAGLRVRAGGSPEEVATLLAGAVKSNPTAVAPRLTLIDHYLAQKDTKRALAVAQEAEAALPRHPEVLDALGRAQVAAGERNQALNTFNRLVALQPGSPQPLMRLAAVHAQAQDLDQARNHLRRALGIRPDLLAAQRALVTLELAAKRPDEALAAARTVRRQRPANAAGYLLEGAVEASRKNLPAAIESYRAGLKATGASELAFALHATLAKAGQQAEADRLGASWLKDHPDDVGFLWHLGSVALSKPDYRLAEEYFQRLDRLQPGNVMVLNNLAWVTAELGKPGAVAYAEKAVALAPDKPVLLDTLAHALAAEQQFAKAIEAEKRALAIAPEAHDIRLALAKLYIRAGDKASARTELDRLAKLEGKCTAQAEVGRLLQTL